MDITQVLPWVFCWGLLWPPGYVWQRSREALEGQPLWPSGEVRKPGRQGRRVRVSRALAILCGRPAGPDHLWVPQCLPQLEAWIGLLWGFALAVLVPRNMVGLEALFVSLGILLVAPVGERIWTYLHPSGGFPR